MPCLLCVFVDKYKKIFKDIIPAANSIKLYMEQLKEYTKYALHISRVICSLQLALLTAVTYTDILITASLTWMREVIQKCKLGSTGISHLHTP